MTVYWLSFVIGGAPADGRSSAKRRSELESMVEAMVNSAESSSLIWKETTSFIIFESSWSIVRAADSLKSVISQHHDLFLIRSMNGRRARICGKVDKAHVFDLMVDKNKTYLKDITDEDVKSKIRQLRDRIRNARESEAGK